MKAGYAAIKNEIVEYYKKTVGFAPAKKDIKILSVDDARANVEIGGKVLGFDYYINVSIAPSLVEEKEPDSE